MQNHRQPPPPNYLVPQQYPQPEQPAGHSAEKVDALALRNQPPSRYYDLDEPYHLELGGPWGPNGGEGTAQLNSATPYHPWDGSSLNLPLVSPYTMQSQQPYPPQHYDGYYPSSTESTPPNGLVPYYIDTQHPQLQQGHPVAPFPPILSPSSDYSPQTPGGTLSDPEAEQKRLRNTAASARFRAKKKKREQSLERESQERRQLVNRLEGRVKELEEENKWLKDLVWEKKERGKKEREDEEGEEGIGFDGEGVGKKEGDRNDGVGTRRA